MRAMLSSARNALRSTLLLGLLVCTTVWAQTGPRQLALTHVTVVNPSEASPHLDSTVLIANDRVVEVGPSKTVKIPRGALIVEASGKFLIPALWDMHVHTENAERDFPMFVANGVLGVRNMAGVAKDCISMEGRDSVGEDARTANCRRRPADRWSRTCAPGGRDSRSQRG